MGLKQLIINRGASAINFRCENGDLYNDRAELLDNGKPIWTSEYVNSDHTIGYKGGILAAGIYYGLVGYRENDPNRRVIKLFRHDDKIIERIKKYNYYLTADDQILPSIQANPNHNGKFIIQYVQVHEGGTKWDWSHGCVSILKTPGIDDYQKLMGCLADNEIIEIKIL